ncbi:ParA family protein [Stecheria sp. CLA-KB-P133]|uniref:ParA family protein n=1 Tax=Grylomicrobium aquisgranensis TaxID=2926318 RepID=A0AB35U5T1_9FIRM|nr:ParA family protein [Stecheria sp. CLA-KB-P133]
MKTIAIAINKGGTGKSTTAAALAQAAAVRSKRVLAIDLDPQANLSFALDASTRGSNGSSYDLLTGKDPAEVTQMTSIDIDVIPASRNLAAVTSSKGSAHRLQRALQTVSGQYDLCIIDTPPLQGELQYNALQAADSLVIPLQADIYGLQSLYQIIDTARHFPSLEIAGIVFTMYDGRSAIVKQMDAAISAEAARMGLPVLARIHKSVVVQEAAALQKNLFQYAPRNKAAADYLELSKKLF